MAETTQIGSTAHAPSRPPVVLNDMNKGYVILTEDTAPSAIANAVILYAVDNGAGKTQLMALFPSGAAQQVLIEA
jgi:hypothetical protein